MSSTEFKLKTDQHDKIVKEVQEGYRNQVDGKLQFKPNFTKRLGKLDEAIKNKPNFEIETQTEEKEIIICLKRKRDDTPLEELYIEAPKNKKKTLHSIISEFENLNFKDENLIHKFSLFQSNGKENESTKTLVEKIKQRKNFKSIETNPTKKNQEKLFEKAKNNRLIKINKSREEEANILKVKYEEIDELEPFKHLLEKNGESIEVEESQDVYDYYYFTEKVNEEEGTIPNLMKFEEQLTFEDEYDSEHGDSDLDSMDSNREDYPGNDYPDEVDTSDEEEEDDEYFGDEYYSRESYSEYSRQEQDDEEL
jgi:hypothetical protein